MAKKLGEIIFEPGLPILDQVKFTVSNLTAYVNYYQCPTGQVTSTGSCGQVKPYGGVAPTIAGDRCFQYFCDGESEVETNSNQDSGCELTNDGLRVK